MRADKFFAESFSSRTKAAEALKKGLILRNGRPLAPNDDVCGTDTFEFLAPTQEFVSNGGYKLARGLDVFQESVRDGVFADLGASTGGFCDCLLQRGAKHVFCVDVGENQLDPRIKSDGRVTVMDGTNARYLKGEDFPEGTEVVSDLSFISLRLVLPAIGRILRSGGRAFVLFKPQFECEGKGLGKSGILPRGRHAALLADFYDFACGLSLAPQKLVNAPVREKKNLEYVLLLRKDGTPTEKKELLACAERLFEDGN